MTESNEAIARQIESGGAGGLAWRPALGTAIRLLLAVAAIGVIFHYEIVRVEDLWAITATPGPALAAGAMLALALAIATVRWFILLRAVGVLISIKSVIQISLIGAFASTFLPGAAGGDAVRAYYVICAASGRRSAAMLSIIADRGLGLLGLLSLGVLLIAVEWELVFASGSTAAFAVLIIGMLVAAIALGGVALSASEWIRGFVVARVPDKPNRLTMVFLAALDAIELYRRNPLALLGSLLLSLSIPLLLIGSLIAFALATGFGNLRAVDFGIAGSLSMLANTIPLTPGGIGVGESAFDYFCKLLESAPSARSYGAVFLAFRIVLALVNLTGALVFVFSGHQLSDLLSNDRR